MHYLSSGHISLAQILTLCALRTHPDCADHPHHQTQVTNQPLPNHFHNPQCWKKVSTFRVTARITGPKPFNHPTNPLHTPASLRSSACWPDLLPATTTSRLGLVDRLRVGLSCGVCFTVTARHQFDCGSERPGLSPWRRSHPPAPLPTMEGSV